MSILTLISNKPFITLHSFLLLVIRHVDELIVELFNQHTSLEAAANLAHY
jgi:hypothetical protein